LHDYALRYQEQAETLNRRSALYLPTTGLWKRQGIFLKMLMKGDYGKNGALSAKSLIKDSGAVLLGEQVQRLRRLLRLA
jgi:hypothetical protein